MPADSAGKESGAGLRTGNRRARADYNAYMREYMKKYDRKKSRAKAQ